MIFCTLFKILNKLKTKTTMNNKKGNNDEKLIRNNRSTNNNKPGGKECISKVQPTNHFQINQL
jgi:hypothetical protein